jgi:hypothetical protein
METPRFVYRYVAHTRIGCFSDTVGVVNCEYRVIAKRGMWRYMSFTSMRNFSSPHMTTGLPARKGVSNRSLYVISIRSVAVHPITNLPDQHYTPTHVFPTLHSTHIVLAIVGSNSRHLDCAKPGGRLVVSTCPKPTVHPKFPQVDTRLHISSDVAHMMAKHRDGVREARVQIPGTYPSTEWSVAFDYIFHPWPKLIQPSRWSLATAVSAS